MGLDVLLHELIVQATIIALAIGRLLGHNDGVGGVLLSHFMKSVVHVTLVLAGCAVLGHGEFDGLVHVIQFHFCFLSGVGRHPFIILFRSEVCFVFLISYVYIIARVLDNPVI